MADDRPNDAVVANFDLFDPALADDPYPTYKHLRTKFPVGWSERHGGFWILSTYEDLDRAYHQPEIYSSYPVAIPPVLGAPGKMIPLEVDPPDHTHYRRILDPFFGPRRIGTILQEASLKLANELLDDMEAKGEFDFVTAFARPFGTILFCTIMGWPLEKRDWLCDMVDQLPGGDTVLDEETAQRLMMEFVPPLIELVESRRQNPADDLTSVLLAARFAGERPLDDVEILNMLFTVMIGGIETVQSQLGLAFSYLGTHHDQRDRIVAHPELIPTAIEEFLRFESPVADGRTVMKDTVVRGITLREGDRVLLLPGSAGRDETVFPDPDEVILDRQPNRHLAFAGGPHRCLGSHMARLELRTAFEEIHRRFPTYTVTDPSGVKKRLGFGRGVITLPFAVKQ